jgi:hypothetical protein
VANGLVLRDRVVQWGCLVVTSLFISDRRILDWVHSVGRLFRHIYWGRGRLFCVCSYERMKSQSPVKSFSIINMNHIQGVPGGKDLTSGECSLGQTIPI